MKDVITMEFVKMALVIVCQVGMGNFVPFLDAKKIVMVMVSANLLMLIGNVIVSHNTMEKIANSSKKINVMTKLIMIQVHL